MGRNTLRKIIKFLFSRIFLAAVGLLLQIFIMFVILTKATEYWHLFHLACLILSFFALIIIINNRTNAGYKIAWITLVLIAPVFGTVFYYMFAGQRVSKKERKKMLEISRALSANVKQEKSVVNKLRDENMDAYRQAKYILEISQDPVFQNSKIEYYKNGETFFKSYIDELKKAENFIFLEYFIIAPGKMWNEILEVLEEKVKNGVDVRIIYDDFGCISTLPKHYDKELMKKGIKCTVFNRFVPFLSIRMNNRDHRKITVIDGKVGFTGGLNLADEYINEKERFGYWKDSAIKIEGDAVWNLTSLFLSIWDYLNNITDDDYKKYKAKTEIKNDSYVSVYGTIPIINETIGENIFLNLINRANKYIYITTPYLVIDNELMTALCNAAKMGMDVRIVMPGIPDKKSVFMLSRSYYQILIDAGIKIYEYSPGFVHSKMIVVDDILATVGTTNFDYRSLYLNYECGAWIYNDPVIMEIKEDILETIKESKEINRTESKKISEKNRLAKALLRFFAPLM